MESSRTADKPPRPQAARCRCGAALEPEYYEPVVVKGETIVAGKWLADESCDRCVAEDDARRERAEREARLQAAIKASGIPPVFAAARIEDLSGPVRDGIERWARGETGLYLFGGPGTGKTYAAAAGLNNRIRASGRACPFRSMPSLYRELRRSVLANADGEAIDALANAEALCLDDLGVGGATDFALSALYELVDRLFVLGRRGLVVTSNLEPDELAKRTDDRIVSRIISICRVLRLDGKDRRLNGRVK